MLFIIVAIIVVLVAVCVFWVRKPKLEEQLFIDRCHGLLDSASASADLGPIVKRIILLVDTQSTMKYPEYRNELEHIYADAKSTKCFEVLKEDINRLFESANRILKHR